MTTTIRTTVVIVARACLLFFPCHVRPWLCEGCRLPFLHRTHELAKALPLVLLHPCACVRSRRKTSSKVKLKSKNGTLETSGFDFYTSVLGPSCRPSIQKSGQAKHTSIWNVLHHIVSILLVSQKQQPACSRPKCMLAAGTKGHGSCGKLECGSQHGSSYIQPSVSLPLAARDFLLLAAGHA